LDFAVADDAKGGIAQRGAGEGALFGDVAYRGYAEAEGLLGAVLGGGLYGVRHEAGVGGGLLHQGENPIDEVARRAGLAEVAEF